MSVLEVVSPWDINFSKKSIIHKYFCTSTTYIFSAFFFININLV